MPKIDALLIPRGFGIKRDGGILASVVDVPQKENNDLYEQVVRFLFNVVPGIQGIEVKHVGKKGTIEFRRLIGKDQEPWRFMVENM